MQNNDVILDTFERILPRKPGWVVVHSSLIGLSINSKTFKWQFLKKIKESVEKGYTFAFASFTFSFCSSGYFDRHHSQSETGLIADWVLDLYDSIRTEHPIYSYVIIGNNAKEALIPSSYSCFGMNSIFQFFEEKNATICMFGCEWTFCTPCHYFEENFKVPYRHFKEFTSKTNPLTKAKMFVRDLSLNPINNFIPAFEELNKQNKIRKIDGTKGIIQSLSFNDLAKVCSEHLSEDLYCYVRNANRIRMSVLDRVEAEASKTIKVAILANNNFEPIANLFKAKFSQYCTTQKLCFYQNSYDQMLGDLHNKKLESLNPDYCFLPSRLEDVYKVGELEFSNLENSAPLNSYINLVIKLNEIVNRRVFVHLFPVMNCPSKGSALMGLDSCLYQFTQQANMKLIAETKNLQQVTLLVPEMLSVEPLILDLRQWYLGRIPYSKKVLDSFATKYCGLILNGIGKTIRLLILDLDNTLWGGVLGEDGQKGISLGGDFPGNAYKDFQRTIIALKNRGVVIAIVSKNDESIAFKCIETHPDMLIKKADLAAYRINWDEKYLNVIDIAKEVGLDYSNIMFIDDNPVEREKIKKNLPTIKVLELPNDPIFYRNKLLHSPYISASEITIEDKKRASSYSQKRVSDEKCSHYENINEFLSSLQMEIQINKLNDLNFSRALQLINKTNQFNTTTQRYDDVTLKNMQNDGDFLVCVVSYQDHQSETENIGVFILQQKNTISVIDTFLLSCRVLGRHLENAILAWIINHVHQQGGSQLRARIVETARNTPVKDLYKKIGFTEESSGNWSFQISQKIHSPSFIKISGNK